MLRILGGEFRSRQLLTPDDDLTSRPYSSRAKESLFNLLRGWFEGTNVIDLFAGVGTMGLEAVSRGAASVLLVERDRKVFDLLKQNIETLKCADRAIAVNADALGGVWIAKASKPVDVIFCDPPYRLMEDERSRQRVLEQVGRCRALMADRGFVVLRSPIGTRDAELSVEGFAGPEEHRYGNEMRVLLYSPMPAKVQSDGDESVDQSHALHDRAQD
jgi:16S rRNA (guanine966-N2)-methyltransferase